MVKIKQAMILAAGLGTRMKDLTHSIPKPMIQVEGISLIERIINYLYLNGVEKIVINTHYLSELFEEHIKKLEEYKKVKIIFSREEELLGTGGGVKNALKHFSDEPFFVLNSDSLFIDKQKSALEQLETAWDPKRMKMLILLVPILNAYGYRYKGDFDLNADGTLNQINEKREFVHPGLYIMDYRVFEHYEENIIQFYPQIMLELIKDKKLFGVVYQGDWYHIGDKEAFVEFPGFRK